MVMIRKGAKPRLKLHRFRIYNEGESSPRGDPEAIEVKKNKIWRRGDRDGES